MFQAVAEVVPPSGWRVRQAVMNWDAFLLLLVRRFEARPLTALARLLTRAGNASGWFILAGLLAAVGPDFVPQAWRLLVAAGCATVLVQPAKRLVRRSRPHVVMAGFHPLVELPDAFSFPSGHTCAAFAVATSLLAAGSPAGPAFAVLALAIAWSRVYLGAHFPLDVLAGAALGVGAGALATRLLA